MLRTAAGDAAIARFEALYRAEARRKALTTLLGGALFLAACVVSAIVGEIDPARLAALWTLAGLVLAVALWRVLPDRQTFIAGLGKLGFLVRFMIPPAHGGHLDQMLAGLAET